MRFRLLQARRPDDPVRSEERRSFAARLGVRPSRITPHSVLVDDLHLEALTDGIDAVLVGGSGDYSVLGDEPWVRPFVDAMGALAEGPVPMFASCFGFQALVLALGGTVVHDEQHAEVGSYEIALTEAAQHDPLFGHLPPSFVAQQGHKDRADTLPASLIHLASSERCRYQAVRVAGQPVWATQFHAELSADDNRTRFERYFAMYERAFGTSEAQRMLDDFQPSPEANRLLARFCARIEQA